MTNLSLTSTTVSGFLEADFDQLKGLLESGTYTAPTFDVTTLSIGSTALTSSAAELNLLTGKTGVLENISEDTTPELGGELDCGSHSIGFTEQSATGDGTTTIDWKLGNNFKFTFGAFNETFTFTAPTKTCKLILVMIQDATGSRTTTWPASVKWPSGTAPTLSTAASSVDIIEFYYDGTNYYGTSSLNFS